jgi:hypothetical protein
MWKLSGVVRRLEALTVRCVMLDDLDDAPGLPADACPPAYPSIPFLLKLETN